MKIELWSADNGKTATIEVPGTSWPYAVLYKDKCYMRFGSRPYELREVKDCYRVPEPVGILVDTQGIPLVSSGQFVAWEEPTGRRFEGSVVSAPEPQSGVSVYCTDGVTRTWEYKREHVVS